MSLGACGKNVGGEHFWTTKDTLCGYLRCIFCEESRCINATIEPELIIHAAEVRAIVALAENAYEEHAFVCDIVPLLRQINLKWPGLLSAILVDESKL